MITQTLNELHQTRHLGSSISTGIYDDGELDALLAEATECAPNRGCETQALSPELLAQILAGGFDSSKNQTA